MRVNEPKMVVFWDVDEVRPLILAMGFGVVLEAMNIAIVLGLVYFILAKKIKAKYANGVVLHMTWWHGFLPTKTTCSMPDAMVRACAGGLFRGSGLFGP